GSVVSEYAGAFGQVSVWVSTCRFRGSEPSGRIVQIVACFVGLSYAQAPAKVRREPSGAHAGVSASTFDGDTTFERAGIVLSAMATRWSAVMYARRNPSGDHAGFAPNPTSTSPVPS